MSNVEIYRILEDTRCGPSQYLGFVIYSPALAATPEGRGYALAAWHLGKRKLHGRLGKMLLQQAGLGYVVQNLDAICRAGDAHLFPEITKTASMARTAQETRA